jgi:hypothetical protein
MDRLIHLLAEPFSRPFFLLFAAAESRREYDGRKESNNSFHDASLLSGFMPEFNSGHIQGICNSRLGTI